MTMSTADRIVGVRARIAEADKQRAQAEATKAMAEQRLAEIDKQIEALGVKPSKAEETLTQLETQLAKELDAVEAGLATESAAYRAILEAAK